MISFNVGNDKFNFRVAGLFIDKSGKRFLTNTANGIDFCVLPGGRVEMGEDTKTSLERELLEELSCKIEVNGLKVITENFFEFDNKNYHELQYVYVGKILDEEIESHTTEFMGTENKDIYKWIHIDDLDSLNYKPAHLKQFIKEVFENNYELKHIINKVNG